MNPPDILVSSLGQVARVVVSNPARRNALTIAMKSRLLETFDRLGSDVEHRCIVISGDGSQSFVSGSDISEFEQLRSDAASEAEYLRVSSAALSAPADVDKPVIASIRGACVGGGLLMAANCDIRIASKNAYFMMPGAKLGIGYPYAGLARFMSLIGPGRAADIFFSARRVDAAEALSLGLINQVVADDELDAAVEAYANEVAANAPLTLRLVKQSTRHFLGAAAGGSMAQLQELLRACSSSEDAIEGRNAFAEKRKPHFRGQ